MIVYNGEEHALTEDYQCLLKDDIFVCQSVNLEMVSCNSSRVQTDMLRHISQLSDFGTYPGQVYPH